MRKQITIAWVTCGAFSLLLVILAIGIPTLFFAMNQDKIEACQTISGELVVRGFRCELPTGEVVNPVKYLENLEG